MPKPIGTDSRSSTSFQPLNPTRNRNAAHSSTRTSRPRGTALNGASGRQCSPVVRKVLPTVGPADEAGSGVGIAAPGRKTQRMVLIFGEELLVDPCGVASALCSQTRRQQDVGPRAFSDEAVANQHAVAQVVAERLNRKLETGSGMTNLGQGCEQLGRLDDILVQAFQLPPVGTSGHQKSEVADLGPARGGPIDFVQDAAPDGGPNATWSQRRRNEVFCAGGPGRIDAGRAGRFGEGNPLQDGLSILIGSPPGRAKPGPDGAAIRAEAPAVVGSDGPRRSRRTHRTAVPHRNAAAKLPKSCHFLPKNRHFVAPPRGPAD